MSDWKIHSKRTDLDVSKFLKVELHHLELPDGTQIEDWPWVMTPDYINIVVMTDAGEFLCFRQGKYGYEGESLALVGGYIEPGEDPLAAAQRELLEETGCKADEWHYFGAYRVDANRGAGIAHQYLATGARQVTEPDADDLEAMTMVLLSRAELEAALVNQEIKALAWAALVARSLLFLRDGK
jgi:ADP-ribose pyrophosphatase